MTKHRRQQKLYQSYLLRLWQTDDGERRVWRASLEAPGTRDRRGFAGLGELFDFLQAQTEQMGYNDKNSG